jgi:hypothetical protein
LAAKLGIRADRWGSSPSTPPREAGLDLASWYWKVVRAFIAQPFGAVLSRSSCLNCRDRLGFVVCRRTKRLTKADAAKREEFVPLGFTVGNS